MVEYRKELNRNMQFLSYLRKNIILKNPFSILLANFIGTEQQKDIEVRTKLIKDYYRIKINVKEFDDDERAKRGLPPFDFNKIEETLNALRNEFDMPFWAWAKLGDKSKLSDLKNYNHAFIYQLKSCNLFCPWCYVDDINKNGEKDNNAEFFTIQEIVDVFEKEREKKPSLNFLRCSGGEPTIAIEQWLYVLEELEKREMSNKVYVQSDTNLTTGHFIDILEEKGEIEKGLLEKIGRYNNFGLLCSFKGTDEKNYSLNTGIPVEECSAFLEENIYTFKKMLNASIDAYPFFYNPNPETIENFLDRLAIEIGDEDIIRKSWVFILKPYGPEKIRLRKRAIKEGIKEEDIQNYIDDYCKNLVVNFNKAKEKMREIMKKRFNEEYQLKMRTSILGEKVRKK